MALSAGFTALRHDVGHQYRISRTVLMIVKYYQQQKRIEMLEKRRIMVGICLIFEVPPQHHDHGMKLT